MIGNTPKVLHNLRIFSQNVQRTKLLTELLLETQRENYDIVFIQEPPWNLIRSAPSSSSPEGEDVIGAPRHPDWVCMVCMSGIEDDTRPRVLSYVHKRLSRMRPSLHKDLVDDRDVMLLSLQTSLGPVFLLNVYSDDRGHATDLLFRISSRLPRCVYMGGDFNCRSKHWELNFPEQPRRGDLIIDIADYLGLSLGSPRTYGPTHFYKHGDEHRSSVIDLIFVSDDHPDHFYDINYDLRDSSDHAPLSISIPMGRSRMERT